MDRVNIELGARCWMNRNLGEAYEQGILQLDLFNEESIRQLRRIANVSQQTLEDWGEEARTLGVADLEHFDEVVVQPSFLDTPHLALRQWDDDWEVFEGTVPPDSEDERLTATPSEGEGSSFIDTVIMVGLQLGLVRCRLDQTGLQWDEFTISALLFRMIMLSPWGKLDQLQRDTLRNCLLRAIELEHPEIIHHSSRGTDFQASMELCTAGIPQLMWTEGERIRCGDSMLTGIAAVKQPWSIHLTADSLKASADMGEYLMQYYFRLERKKNLSHQVHCLNGKARTDCDGDHYYAHELMDRIPPHLIVHFDASTMMTIEYALLRGLLKSWSMPINGDEDAAILDGTPFMVVLWANGECWAEHWKDITEMKNLVIKSIDGADNDREEARSKAGSNLDKTQNATANVEEVMEETIGNVDMMQDTAGTIDEAVVEMQDITHDKDEISTGNGSSRLLTIVYRLEREE